MCIFCKDNIHHGQYLCPHCKKVKILRNFFDSTISNNKGQPVRVALYYLCSFVLMSNDLMLVQRDKRRMRVLLRRGEGEDVLLLHIPNQVLQQPCEYHGQRVSR